MKQIWFYGFVLVALSLFSSAYTKESENMAPVKEEEKPLKMSERPVIILDTTQGQIQIALFPKVAPKASENFLRLAEKGYYNDVIFHRVIKGFMIQGGDPTGTGMGGQSIWGTNFADEVSPSVKFDKPGLLAMANRGPSTNGSQFFITTAPTPWLNGKHTIFGEVISGYDVVQKIEGTKTDARDRPLEPQKILKISVKTP
jgi:peptidylprolyl isomerase